MSTGRDGSWPGPRPETGRWTGLRGCWGDPGCRRVAQGWRWHAPLRPGPGHRHPRPPVHPVAHPPPLLTPPYWPAATAPCHPHHHPTRRSWHVRPVTVAARPPRSALAPRGPVSRTPTRPAHCAPRGRAGKGAGGALVGYGEGAGPPGVAARAGRAAGGPRPRARRAFCRVVVAPSLDALTHGPPTQPAIAYSRRPTLPSFRPPSFSSTFCGHGQGGGLGGEGGLEGGAHRNDYPPHPTQPRPAAHTPPISCLLDLVLGVLQALQLVLHLLRGGEVVWGRVVGGRMVCRRALGGPRAPPDRPPPRPPTVAPP